MSNITISNESLSFLQKHRNASFAHQRNLKPFVSFVQDSEDSDSDRSSVMLTPKLQEHTRYIDRRTFENGITPVKLNLSKRFTNAASVTPSKIYQLASEVSEEEGSGSSKNIKENTTKKNSRSHSKSYNGRGKDLPRSPDYDMDSFVEAPKRSRTSNIQPHKHKRSSNKQIPVASEEENEEPPKPRRRNTSKPEQVLPSLSPQPKLKPGRPSVHADSNSIDMVIESVVRASPLKRQNESPSKVPKKTMADEVRKQTAKRGSKPKSLKTNINGNDLNDMRASGAVGSGMYHDSASVPQKNSESDGGERRTRRKAHPTSASRLEFDWNCSSEDTTVKTPKKGPRSTSKEGSRKRTRSSNRLTYQLDSTEDEVNQPMNKSNAVFKTPPAVENRPQVSKTPSSVKPLPLLSAAIYSASEDENTESTEVETPSSGNQNIRTPIRSDAKLTGDRIFSPNRSARKMTVVVSPNKAAENSIQSQVPAGPNVQTTPKSILKPRSSEGANASPMIQSHPQKSSVTTLTSLEIVSPVRTSSVRTESTMTSTVASFELISSPAREIPISSPGVETSHISKSVMPAQGGIKRKYSALPTSLNTKRSRQQMDVNRQSESTSRDLAIESSEAASWDVEAGRSSMMPQEVFIPRIEANRLNPYASTAGDPLSTKQLLQSNEYRISYLELLPECFFSLRAHCKTSIVMVAGTVTLHCREPSTEKVLDAVHRLVDLVPGSLYHLHNSGDVIAHFQMIESLQDWID